MNFDLHPSELSAMIAVVLAIVACVLAFCCRSAPGRVLFGLLVAALLVSASVVVAVVNPWPVDARFRTYRAFYKDIQVGMTRSQVRDLLQKHYPEGGTRSAPVLLEDTDNRLDFFMNPESSKEPNCEGIFLTMEHDLVAAASYSAD